MGSAASTLTARQDLAKAIEAGDTDGVSSLIKRHSSIVDERLPVADGPPALVLAARSGRKEIVEILLTAGAHIDRVDDCGQTACHAAVSNGRAAVLAVLVERRPNLGLSDLNGRAPLADALLRVPLLGDSLVTMLIRGGAPLDRKQSFRVASLGVAPLQALCERGCVIRELRGDFNCTPLHTTGVADPEVIARLIDVCGVDVNAPDSQGNTCSHYSAYHNNDVLLRLFVDAGADLACVNEHGCTPLHMACSRGSVRAILLLLAAGACADVRSANGESALRCALRSPIEFALPIARLLLAGSAEIGESDRQTLADGDLSVDGAEIAIARCAIARRRVDFVRSRALQVCIGMHSLNLDALQMCEILVHACGPVAPVIAFHHWWRIATTVKHFRS